MANTYKLIIVSQEAALYDGEIESLVAPGAVGYFGIWAKHAPFLTALQAGKISVRENPDKLRTFEIQDGILEVSQNGETTILTEKIKEIT